MTVPICTSPSEVSTSTVPDNALPKLYVVARNDLTAALLIKVLPISLLRGIPDNAVFKTDFCCNSVISSPAVSRLLLIEVKLVLKPSDELFSPGTG